MQVSSRFLLVWAIVDSFPFLAFSPVYSSMLFAWSVTEVVRYSYFALTLSGWQPAALTWLRYNTFFVLYPIGILSECSLIYMAADPAGMRSPIEKYFLYVILAIYVPGQSLSASLRPCFEGVRAYCAHGPADPLLRCLYPLHPHDDAAQKGYALPEDKG